MSSFLFLHRTHLMKLLAQLGLLGQHSNFLSPFQAIAAINIKYCFVWVFIFTLNISRTISGQLTVKKCPHITGVNWVEFKALMPSE